MDAEARGSLDHAVLDLRMRQADALRRLPWRTLPLLLAVALMANDFLGLARSLSAPVETSTDYLGATVPAGIGGQPSPEIASSGGFLPSPAGVNEGGSVETAGVTSTRGMLDEPATNASQSMMDALGGSGFGFGGDAGEAGNAPGQVGDIGMQLSGVPSGTLGELAGLLGLPGGKPAGDFASVAAGLAGIPTSLLTLLAQFLPAIAPAAGPVGMGIAATNAGMAIADQVANMLGFPTNQQMQEAFTIDEAVGLGAPGSVAQGFQDEAVTAISDAGPGVGATLSPQQAVALGSANPSGFNTNMSFDPVTGGYVYFSANNPNDTGLNQFGSDSGPGAGGAVGSGAGVGAGGDVEAP